MERVPMLRQIIAQLEQVLELYASPLPPSDFFTQIQGSTSRCCMFDVEAGFLEGNYHNLSISDNMKTVEQSILPKKKSRKECNLANKIISRSSSEIMDENIWKELPEDLLEAIISRLPVEALFQFRVVCHKWNILLNSQSFSQKRQSETWFFISSIVGIMGSMYNPSSKKWYHPPSPNLPVQMRLLPVASSGGLICLYDCKRIFYIYNPLTFSWKELPPLSIRVISRVSVGMTLNSEFPQLGYKIIFIGHDGEYVIYDSSKSSWSYPEYMPSSILPLALYERSQPVCVNRTTLYFLCDYPDGLVSFNMETEIWKQFPVPTPQHLSNKMLAECNGRILLVGLLKKNAATCICIWKLEKMTLLWKEVDRMPNLWCLDLYGKQVRMNCLGNKGLIMLSLRSFHTSWLITYDPLTRDWVKVNPRWSMSWRQLIFGTAFNPCLAALP